MATSHPFTTIDRLDRPSAYFAAKVTSTNYYVISPVADWFHRKSADTTTTKAMKLASRNPRRIR